MLTIRRTYLTWRLPKLTPSLKEQISIGKFVQSTTRSCPKRNQVLGDHFFRYAVRLNLYSTANNEERNDRKLMHSRYIDAAKQLDLANGNIEDSSHIKLPSTGEFLSESISKSLNKWRKNAHHEIQDLYQHEQVSDKFIVEMVRGINHSLIGWYLQTYGMQNALAFIQWLGVPLFSLNSKTYTWPQPKSPLLIKDSIKTQHRMNLMLDGYDILETKLGYKFRNKAYLLQAVTHESFTSNNLTPSYRGLDFVGDAIVNYIIIRHLFRQPQHFHADDLTNLSSLLYSNSSLATISVRNEFHKFLRYTAPEIRDNINSFVALLRLNRFQPANDVYFLDRKNFIFEVPPIIPDSFEALIAAIYFDSMMDLNAVSDSLFRLMQWDLKWTCQTKPKTAYIELAQLDETAEYSKPVTVASGKIKVTVTLPKFQYKSFSGFSRDAQLAKWAAAKSAVLHLNSRQNEFIPTKHRELVEHFKKLQ